MGKNNSLIETILIDEYNFDDETIRCIFDFFRVMETDHKKLVNLYMYYSYSNTYKLVDLATFKNVYTRNQIIDFIGVDPETFNKSDDKISDADILIEFHSFYTKLKKLNEHYFTLKVMIIMEDGKRMLL